MSIKPNIEVTIEPDGTVKTRVVGGRGWSCRNATQALRDAIGLTTEDKPLPEFFQQQVANPTIKQGGRS